jgi:hypothetical protein
MVRRSVPPLNMPRAFTGFYSPDSPDSFFPL